MTAFIAGNCPSMRKGTAKLTVTALRSLLGYLHVAGDISGPLAWAVPAVATWRLASLPAPLEPGQVAAMLAGCDTGTVSGRRDLAMLTLLARLGLRAGEVAALSLDDIDWRAGEVTVTGKGRRSERLPLPADVGEAVAAWLRDGRPAPFEGTRRVFLRLYAPHRGLTTGGVTQAVFAAAQRAGLGRVSAHRLRHTAATRFPGRGVPARGRAGAAAPAAAVDGDLREDRRPRAARASAPLAGRRGKGAFAAECTAQPPMAPPGQTTLTWSAAAAPTAWPSRAAFNVSEGA